MRGRVSTECLDRLFRAPRCCPAPIHIFFVTFAHPRLAASAAGHHNPGTMKLTSTYFDSIRVKPRQPDAEESASPCQWPGCARHGGYRAPKGRRAEGEYHDFCLDHVKEYNKTYNYFAGMDDEAVRVFQKADATGHRPTWKLGKNSWAAERRPFSPRRRQPEGSRRSLRAVGGTRRAAESAPVPRALRNRQKKALRAPRPRRACDAGAGQGTVQDAGQALPPRCQWRQPERWRTVFARSSRPMIVSASSGFC